MLQSVLWDWTANTTTGFRHVIDARLAFTLRHQGVTHFAGFGFEKVWNPAG